METNGRQNSLRLGRVLELDPHMPVRQRPPLPTSGARGSLARRRGRGAHRGDCHGGPRVKWDGGSRGGARGAKRVVSPRGTRTVCRHRTGGHAGPPLDGGPRGRHGMMGDPGPAPGRGNTRGPPPDVHGGTVHPPAGGAKGRPPHGVAVTAPDGGARSRSYRDWVPRGAAPGRRQGAAPDTGGQGILVIDFMWGAFRMMEKANVKQESPR